MTWEFRLASCTRLFSCRWSVSKTSLPVVVANWFCAAVDTFITINDDDNNKKIVVVELVLINDDIINYMVTVYSSLFK